MQEKLFHWVSVSDEAVFAGLLSVFTWLHDGHVDVPNKEMAGMMVYQINPLGIKVYIILCCTLYTVVL